MYMGILLIFPYFLLISLRLYNLKVLKKLCEGNSVHFLQVFSYVS